MKWTQAHSDYGAGRKIGILLFPYGLKFRILYLFGFLKTRSIQILSTAKINKVQLMMNTFDMVRRRLIIVSKYNVTISSSENLRLN